MLIFGGTWFPGALLILQCTSAVVDVEVTLTTADETHLFQRMPGIVPQHVGGHGIACSDDVAVVEVDARQRFQTMLGFGATLAASSAYVISKAPQSVQDAVLERLFGPESGGGIGLNMLRLPIGVTEASVNYTLGHMSYDDHSYDWSLSRFTTSADEDYYVPVIQKILKINPHVRFVASPWTAPLWLKTDSSSLGSGTLLEEEGAYLAYADYLVRYLEDYLSKGIRISYLTLQNEPGHGGCGPMPCMILTPKQEVNLAQHVRVRLQRSIAKHTKLLAYDHNWGFSDFESFIQWCVLLILIVPQFLLICIVCHCFRPNINGHLPTVYSRVIVMGEDGGALLGDACLQQETSMREVKAAGQLPHDDSGHRARCCCGSSCAMAAARIICIADALFFFSLQWATHNYPTFLPGYLGQFPMGPAYPLEVLNSTAGQAFAGVAWHCYGGDASAMSEVASRYPELEQHITECSYVPRSFSDYLPYSQTALFMAGVRNHAKSVMFWNLAADEDAGPRCSGGSCCSICKGVVTVPSDVKAAGDLHYNAEFYALAHHSAFLDAGSQHIFSAVSGTGIDAVAYRRSDAQVVLVATNTRNSSNVTLQVDASGVRFQYCLPPGSVATFRWRSYYRPGNQLLTEPSTAPVRTFYVYRAMSDSSFPPEDVNSANIHGVMWYLHNEVVFQAPRKFDITRILRYRVSYKAPEVLFRKGTNFGIRYAFDSGKCTGPGYCPKQFNKYGYFAGCNYVWQYPTQQFTDAINYTNATWFSFPGACSDRDFRSHDAQCVLTDPGGACFGIPTGEGDCTYSYERAGEIRLDDLVGIRDYDQFVLLGGREFDRSLDTGVNLTFWDNKTDTAKNEVRVAKALAAFEQKYPLSEHLQDVACDFDRQRFESP
ncbi:unnamed protein product [Polarella glacialis]|uniref:Glucosylceramidase n=1 Tax=Polarella glacialis TaxID=89957 RepID=A0A813D982_POLGL|nr:unnamed protein product [Polarella glacialis]CAE8674560.1 unnamed protein product [Polarella glacialis]